MINYMIITHYLKLESILACTFCSSVFMFDVELIIVRFNKKSG